MGKPKHMPGKHWPDSPGAARAHECAVVLLGAVAMIRETRAFAGSAKFCELGHANMAVPPGSQLRPMLVLGSGSTWPKAIAAATIALENPATRAEAERHDELLAALVAQRRAAHAEAAAAEAPAEGT